MTQNASARKPTARVKSTRTAMARKRLWLFAQFIDKQNPEALAAEVTLVSETLYHCARIQMFFHRYAAAVRKKAGR